MKFYSQEEIENVHSPSRIQNWHLTQHLASAESLDLIHLKADWSFHCSHIFVHEGYTDIFFCVQNKKLHVEFTYTYKFMN